MFSILKEILFSPPFLISMFEVLVFAFSWIVGVFVFLLLLFVLSVPSVLGNHILRLGISVF